MTSMVPMGPADWATPEIEIFEPQPPAGSGLAGPAIGWPAGRMAGWLTAGQLSGWLAGWLAFRLHLQPAAANGQFETSP